MDDGLPPPWPSDDVSEPDADQRQSVARRMSYLGSQPPLPAEDAQSDLGGETLPSVMSAVMNASGVTARSARSSQQPPSEAEDLRLTGSSVRIEPEVLPPTLHQRRNSVDGRSRAVPLSRNAKGRVSMQVLTAQGRRLSAAGARRQAGPEVGAAPGLDMAPEDLRLMVETALSQMAMFRSCSRQFVKDLSELGLCWAAPRGGDVLREGDPAQSLLLILRGQVSVTIEGVIVGILSSGDAWGEAALLGLDSRTMVTLTATAATTICEILEPAFVPLLENHRDEYEMFHAIKKANHDLLGPQSLASRSDLFRSLPRNCNESLHLRMPRRIFFPGEVICREGDPNTALYIMLYGLFTVEIAGRMVRAEQRGFDEDVRPVDAEDVETTPSGPGAWGVMEVLGLADHACSTITATTVCHVRVLHRSVLQYIIKKPPAGLPRENPLISLSQMDKPQVMLPGAEMILGIFKEAGCHGPFMELLTGHLEARLFSERQTIDEGEGKSLYVILLGTAKAVLEDGREVELTSGQVFGGFRDLCIKQRPEGSKTIIAGTHCLTKVLHQSVIVRALEQFPEERQKVLLVEDTSAKIADFVALLRRSPFFVNLQPAFVEELSLAATDRIYMPGDFIFQQGQEGESMFIMNTGYANVLIGDIDSTILRDKSDQMRAAERVSQPNSHHGKKQLTKVGQLGPGAICGELAMLGVTEKRSASVQAVDVCIMWEVTQERALAILDRHPEDRDLFRHVVCRNLERTVPSRLLSVPLFKAFDRKFRIHLSLYCERLAFFPEHQIVQENQPGDKLFILNLGPVILQKKGFTVKTFAPGSYFGVENMLGLAKVYLGTVISMKLCHLIAISRASYLLSLEQYPSGAAAQELLRVQKLETRELREVVQRTIVRKCIWQRYQRTLDKSSTGHTEQDLLQRVVQGWAKKVREVREKKQQDQVREAIREETVGRWMHKAQEGSRRVGIRKRMREIISHNILERGPMLYPDEDPIYLELLKEPKEAEPLPPLQPQLSEHTIQLAELRKAWPSPRPSPHYKLKLWQVLGDSAEASASSPKAAPQTEGSSLLPLLLAKLAPAPTATQAAVEAALAEEELQRPGTGLDDGSSSGSNLTFSPLTLPMGSLGGSSVCASPSPDAVRQAAPPWTLVAKRASVSSGELVAASHLPELPSVSPARPDQRSRRQSMRMSAMMEAISEVRKSGV